MVKSKLLSMALFEFLSSASLSAGKEHNSGKERDFQVVVI
jgi:hypothetical protein